MAKKSIKNIFLAHLLVATLLAGVYSQVSQNRVVSTVAMPVSKKIIVIDPGHGGYDPGKTLGSNQVEEKTINLQISLKLQALLEQGGAIVLMTRVDDSALANSKYDDLSQRVYLANRSKAHVMISIHQNSYPTSDVKGPQVFYESKSDKGKALAGILQDKLQSNLGIKKKRDAKPNENYYVLKRTVGPAVIVECGFMTNPGERKKLIDDSYQDKIAWSIYMGLIDYFSQEKTADIQ